MNTIRLEVSGKIFLLNNNGDKYNRATNDAGEKASEFEILAYYDKLGGLIQDEQGKNIENGQFWSRYQNFKGLVELLEKNDESLREAEGNIYPLINENVSQKRIFLGTLMTIAAAVIAGLFFLFSKDYISDSCAQLLAKISGLVYALFIVLSSAWLTALLSQESLKLDGRIQFYKRTGKEFMERAGNAIKSEDDFREFLNKKLEESGKIEGRKIFGDQEWWFVGISSLFILASLPLMVLFLLA